MPQFVLARFIRKSCATYGWVNVAFIVWWRIRRQPLATKSKNIRPKVIIITI